jgi:hypothetical protein
MMIMNSKRVFAVIVMLTFVLINVFGQDDCSYKTLVAKIDSIMKVKNIELGMVKFHRVTSAGESTTTESYVLNKKYKFVFDGPFLVVGGSYYNLNKLLFFFIREDYIEFYFQGY